jgi:hypothetical protein
MNRIQKTPIKKFSVFLVLTFMVIFSFAGEKHPLTVAESSDFAATSTYSDVIDFIHSLQKEGDSFRVETICMTTEKRAIPLLVIGDPLPSSPRDLAYDNRAVIYIQGNIHAGEVEGKEACLMMIRDILQADDPPYLDNLVLLICPIFNADGNERISPQNRRNQVGPEKGVGIRYNGQNLDLNRDGIKLESPEVQGLVSQVLNRWDPVLFVDCHTTNGSYHVEPVTYLWPLNPNGDTTLISYMREKMMPSIQKVLKERYNTLSIPYGNFMDFKNPEKGWRTAGPQPRYITNYIGLRNRLAILNENYAYADYKTRVMGCYHFLLSILDYCSQYKDEIQDLIARADRETIRKGKTPDENNRFGLSYTLQPLEEPVTVIGWEMEVLPSDSPWPRVKKTDKERTYSLPYYVDFVVDKSVRFPFGYLIPIQDKDILEKLLMHGLLVERLLEPISLEVESFLINEIKGAPRIFQGHRINTVEGEYSIESLDFEAGTLFVPTSQPLGTLAAYLLEPESDDGLLVWNFFDSYIVHQWRRGPQTYPVYRLLEPTALVKEILR